MSQKDKNTDTKQSRSIPEGWVETTLGELGKLARGKSKHRPRWAPHLFGGKYPFIQTGQIKSAEKYITEYEQTYSEEGLAQSKLWKRDTLCITIAANIAEIAILKFPACFPDSVLGFIADKEKSDLNFIYYNFSMVQAELRQLSIGSVQDNINLGTFEKLIFLIPPLPEQKAIANILTAFDDKIENLRAQNDTLEQTAQTLFTEWFGKYQLEDELPEGWRVGKLGEEFEIIMGQSPKGSSYNEEGNGTLFFQGRAEFTTRFPNKRLYTTEPKRIAEMFDVLVSVRAPVGDINVVNELCCIGRGLAAVKSRYKSYALYKLQSLKSTFDLFESEGTVFGSINKDSFSNIEVIIPTIKVIQEFNIITSNLDMKIFKNSEQIQTLTQTRDTLLPKLMSGQLRVKNIETLEIVKK